VLSFGYFSLHKQRKVTRSAGVKALDFDFDLAVKAVAFRLLVFLLGFNDSAAPSSALRAPSPGGRREQQKFSRRERGF